MLSSGRASTSARGRRRRTPWPLSLRVRSPYTRPLHPLTIAGPDPLPAIPALPPAAPSFAERLNPDLRRSPQTPVHPEPNASFPELVPRPLQVLPFQGPPTPPRSRGEDPAIQPPLPLVLRPPLRKKKSFSRVSTWLFPAHQRGVSVDSVTNLPRPVRGEGFYQCVSPPVTARRSGETVSSVASWGSGEGTVPTTLSAGSPMGRECGIAV